MGREMDAGPFRMNAGRAWLAKIVDARARGALGGAPTNCSLGLGLGKERVRQLRIHFHLLNHDLVRVAVSVHRGLQHERNHQALHVAEVTRIVDHVVHLPSMRRGVPETFTSRKLWASTQTYCT